MNKIVKPLRSGQVTIPADFREKLGIDSDTLLQITLMEGELRIKPVRTTAVFDGSSWFKELYDLFAPVRKEAKEKRLSSQEIDEAIDQAVKAVRKSHAKSSL